MNKKIPPLLYTTTEGRRVYEFHAKINQRLTTEIHIDPHYEEEHGSYMTDEIIYNFAWELNEGKFIPEKRTKDWNFYSTIFFRGWRAYEMIWCLKDGANFLGVRTCYRRSKHDKEH